MITPFATLEHIPDSTDLEMVEARLLKIDPPKSFGQGTIQSSYAEDATGTKIGLRFVDYEPITADWVGPWFRISATRNGKNELTGLSVSSYNGKKRIDVKGADQHGRQRTEIIWLEGVPSAPSTSQPVRQGPPHRPDVVYDTHQQPARQPMGPPPRQAGPPARPASPIQQAMSQPPAQPRPPVPAGPPGEAVGLAIKLVFEPLLQNWSDAEGHKITAADTMNDPEFWRACYRGCSEILNLSEVLKGGDIAPSIVTTALPDYPALEAEAVEEEWTA